LQAAGCGRSGLSALAGKLLKDMGHAQGGNPGVAKGSGTVEPPKG
jgi:hypothetical protein